MPALDHVVVEIPGGEKGSVAHVASQLLVYEEETIFGPEVEKRILLCSQD